MRIVQDIAGILYPSLNKTLKKRNMHLQSVKISSKTANLCGAWGDKEIVPTCCFGEGTFLLFEDISAVVPVNCDLYLRHIYGDYMKLPPEEKRKGHHYTEIVDLDKPYTEYMK